MRHLITLALALLATASQAQVYRCSNTYTDEPCKGGRAVDTSPPVSDPRGPQTKVIYLCRASTTYRYWTPEPCSASNATIERTERVPANLPWEDQLAIARAQRDEAQIYSSPQPSMNSQPVYDATHTYNAQKEACAALETRIKYLDDEGRRGGSGYKMDWIRKERLDARNEQLRIRCR